MSVNHYGLTTSGVCVVHPVVNFYVVFYRSVLILFVFAIALSVLRFTASHYPFDKSKYFLLTNQGPSRGNKLNYKYTYKGERIVWLIDRHNNTIVKQYVWTYKYIKWYLQTISAIFVMYTYYPIEFPLAYMWKIGSPSQEIKFRYVNHANYQCKQSADREVRSTIGDGSPLTVMYSLLRKYYPCTFCTCA